MTKRHHSIPQTHPGAVLREDVLPSLNISKAEFARRLGISRQHLYDILNEKQPVSSETAVRLGKLCGNGPRLWANLQSSYDLWQAEMTVDVSDMETLKVA